MLQKKLINNINMKKIFFFFVILSLSSCKTYIDSDFSGNKISNNSISIEYFEDYNIIKNNDKIGAVRDKDVSYPQLFKLMMPKKIESFKIINKVFCIEYNSKQVIFIDAGFKNSDVNLENWKLLEANDELINSYCNNYLSIEKIARNKRVNKLYTDGKTKILLINIKSKNFDNYLKLIKSFKYE